MKVDMSRLNEISAVTGETNAPDDIKETDAVLPVDEEDDAYDNSDRHSGLKAFLLMLAMLGGLALFVWNMTAIVNNMRLDNQGAASSIVYELKDLTGFGDGEEGSGAEEPKNVSGSAVSTDTPRDGPGETPGPAGDDEIAALKQEADDAKNEAALVRQELKNAEDMLDSSLAREAELQKNATEN